MTPDLAKGIFVGLFMAAAIGVGCAAIVANVFWKGMR
ncbi:hypothetical protein sphantq_02921 [Sphingobium sp. AntQ-1]|nr:hypothetical protein sphantq_02921 [Sphingobium sp. AntQ-1]